MHHEYIKRLFVKILFLVFLLILSTDITGQKYFQLSDSSFTVGQIYMFNVDYFIYKDYELEDQSKIKIDSIVEFLKINKNIEVEFGMHSDFRGSSQYNDSMTNIVASLIYNYIVEHGIEKSRLSYFGYGENYPIVVDEFIHQKYSFLPIGQILSEDYIQCLETYEDQETANEFNRRCEMKIIRIKKCKRLYITVLI